MLDCAKTWGRAAFVGEGHTATFDISQQITHKQLTMIAWWVYSTQKMMELSELVFLHGIPLGRLPITDRFDLDDAPSAAPMAARTA